MSQKIAHMVYFQLEDPTPENIEAMIGQCKKYLDNHEGLEYFGAGALNEDLSREVNVKDFHVSLHTVFTDREAHDRYQVDPRHLEFIESNKAGWKSVRVFDSNLG
ncbi:MAG: Dabb family protein [Aureliella sp.]